MHTAMSIRQLLITLLGLLGLLIVFGSVWEFNEARAKAEAVAWFEQTNRLSELSLLASSVVAMERGITAAILSNPPQAGDSMRHEMEQQRQAADHYYRQMMAIAHALPRLPSLHPITSAMHDLSRSRGELEAYRQRVDRIVQENQAPGNQHEWITVASRHVDILADVRRATISPLPNNIYSFTPNPIMMEILFTISEYAGRERAIIGAAIASDRPLDEEELKHLRQYRDIVEMGLQRSESMVRQFPVSSELIEASGDLSNHFLGSYEQLRQVVYAASEAGMPYPVSAEQWYAEATRGINSVLALSAILSKHMQQNISQLRSKADTGTALIVLMLLLTTLIFVVAVIQVRRRILEPLQRLEQVTQTIASGNLEQALPAFPDDELGHLAVAFEQMRKTLLADIRQRDAHTAELRKLSRAVEQSADAVIITDHRHTIEYVNSAFESSRGYPREEVIGKNAAIFKSDLNDPKIYQAFGKALERGEVFRTTLSSQRADGSIFFEEITLSPLRDGEGVISHYIMTGKDITKRILAERELRKLSQVIEQSVSSVIITDPEGVIEYVNPQFTRSTGYSREEVLGKRMNVLNSGCNSPAQYRVLWETILNGMVWKGELLNRRKSGELYWEQVSISPVRDDDGTITHFVGLQHDISETKRLEEQLNFLAYYDELTQLPNRTLLTRHFTEAAARCAQNDTLLALLTVDLSRFKLINDSLGYGIGDRVLFEVGKRLTELARSHDTVARYGGDEFVVILADLLHITDIGTIARRMIDVIAQPVSIDSHELRLASYVGISVMPQDGEDFDTLLQNSATALHQAKIEGRNQFHFYTDELNELAQQRLSLEHDLRRALENDELMLYYQPKVDFVSGEVIGVEALARWHHPDKGYISPDRFIPVAEETGLIMQLGEWALREACRQNSAWQQAGLPPISVAVNLSAIQLRQQRLDRLVASILKEYQLDPKYLELELTESAVMDGPEETALLLNRLKGLGLQLAVDDFGTGYSSLSHLRRFPFDMLKIDRSFVSNITSSPDEATIARTIIAMAHNLHLTVVAEGVETQAQANYLRNHGCDVLQGFLFSKPLPAEQMEQLLREGRTLELKERDDSDQRTLLLIDTHPEHLAALQQLFAGQDYTILGADSASEAFDILALQGAGVIICNQDLPQLSGLEFFDRLKELYPETVRIVLGKSQDQERFLRAQKDGVVHRYLTLPWRDEELRSYIDKAFILYRAICARVTL